MTEALRGPVPDDVELVARANVTRLGAEWEVRVELQSRLGTGERRLRVQSCPEAADFVALAVTMAIEPASEEPESQPNVPPPGDPGPAPLLLAEEARSSAEDPEESPAGAFPFRFGIQAGALASVGALPEPALGLEAGLTSALGPWQLRTAFRWYPTQEVTVAGTPEEALPIAYEVLGGALALGYRARLRALLLIPTLTAEFAQLGGTGSRELWIRLEGGLEVTLARTAPFEPFVSLGLSLPLSQPTFAIEGDVVAHRPGLGGAAALGLRAFFLGP